MYEQQSLNSLDKISVFVMKLEALERNAGKNWLDTAQELPVDIVNDGEFVEAIWESQVGTTRTTLKANPKMRLKALKEGSDFTYCK